jgi:1,4-dihydroxy-2-naphthoate octaprenyltransferase
VFYTWPLKYVGLGELTVLLVWGPLMIGGTYYVVSGGVWSWGAALASVAYAIGPTNVLIGKHTDKIPDDRQRGVNTLPVLVGEPAARTGAIALWILQLALIGLLVAVGWLGPTVLVTLLALPRLAATIRVFARPRPTEAPPDLGPNVWPLYLSRKAFHYSRFFGMLFLLGLASDLLLTRLGWL